MDATPEDLQWLAHQWPKLRSLLTRTVSPLLDDAVDEIAETGKAGEATWRKFVESALRALATRAADSPIHGTAMIMLHDITPFRKALEETGSRLGGDSGGRLRALAIRRGVTRLRDVLLAGSVDRGKTWSLIDAISRRIWDEKLLAGGGGPGGRCSADHMVDVLAEIRARHPGHHSLPRTLDSVEKWFADFCSDCRPAELEAMEGFEWIEPEHVDSLPDLAAHADGLELCIEALEPEQRRFVEVHYRLSDPIEFSTTGYCTRMGLDRRRFYRILDLALAALRDCLTRKVDDMYEETGYSSAWKAIYPLAEKSPPSPGKGSR